MQPTSSLSRKRTANYDQFRTIDPLINGPSKTGTSHLSSHKLSIGLADAPCSQSLTSDRDTITSASKKEMIGKQHSSPLKDYSNQWSCSLA